MAIDPGRLTRDLLDDYGSYLSSRFFFKDTNLREQFASQLSRDHRLVAGPFVELTPPFKEGASPRGLVTRRVLTDALLRLPDDALYPDRMLYLHQERAIEKVQSGRNVIVATGTGSGKTETYLLPIIDHLLREQSPTESLRPGIRALLIYPMNALANDQLKRIRHLLRSSPGVTFGRYIGETPTSRAHGIRRFRETWPQEPVISNELKSREEMWVNPPHILITNFAMLEYLLVRPQDSVFFTPEWSSALRFLVLDEIHTYDGAKGTEIAMLIRRLKQRIGINQRGALRCIGTSATLGGGRDLYDVAEFADALFNEPFVFNLDGAPTDVVDADRISYQRPDKRWCPIDSGFYTAIATLPKPDAQTLKRLIDCQGTIPTTIRAIATEIIETTLQKQGPRNESRAQQPSNEWFTENRTTDRTEEFSETISQEVFSQVLYEILRGDTRVCVLQEACADGPKPLNQLERLIFNDVESNGGASQSLLDLIAVASKATSFASHTPLIRARYHFFLRSLEGGFVCLEDHNLKGPKLYLERRKTCIDHPNSKVFEVGVCRRCGQALLVGSLFTDPYSGRRYLTSEDPTQEMLIEDERRQRVILTPNASVNDILNEDEIVEGVQDNTPALFVRMRICCSCGVLGNHESEWTCDCGDKARVQDVYRVPNRDRDIELCPSCGSRSLQRDILQTLYTGPDEPVAELATTIFQTSNESYYRGDGEKKKLLTFSDSRQDAAYFAPYLETLYRTTLRRHVMLSLIKPKGNHGRWRIW